jgi:hypothetical protein
VNEDLKRRLEAMSRPSDADVLGSRQPLLDMLIDGAEHSTSNLVEAGARAEQLSGPATGHNAKDFDLEQEIGDDHPVVRWFRLITAASEALFELESAGVIVPTGTGTGPQRAHAQAHWRQSGSSGGVQWQLSIPALNSTYQLHRRFRSDPGLLGLDPDLLVTDLTTLALGDRARRTLTEALTAYRNGLYLACAALLGTAVEGAWYAAGEKLRHEDTKIDKLLDAQQTATARLQRAIADRIQGIPHIGSITADELFAESGIYRALRNYGVHPREQVRDDLEPYFTETRCRLLLMTTHRHLTRLDDAVHRAVGGD